MAFAFPPFHLSTLLPLFAPRSLPSFLPTTMAALTSVRFRLRAFLPAQFSMLPYDTFPAFPPQPSPTARFSRLYEECVRKRMLLLPLASPIPRRLAAVANQIGFTFVWDRRSASGCSPPRLTTTQLPLAAIPLRVSEQLRLSLVDFIYVHSHAEVLLGRCEHTHRRRGMNGAVWISGPATLGQGKQRPEKGVGSTSQMAQRAQRARARARQRLSLPSRGLSSRMG